MKALSIKQPWANMIAEGEKTIETRTWSTPYRGPILIVSSKNPPIPPAGMAIATAVLVNCRRMEPTDELHARCDYFADLWSWVLEEVEPLAAPFPVRGQLGIYEVEVPSQPYVSPRGESEAETQPGLFDRGQEANQ